MNRTIRKVAFLWIGLCISALTGCVSWFYTPGMGELKRLCRLDGGDKIYQVVHTEGYFDANGQLGRTDLMRLIRSDYQFIEYEEAEKPFYHYSAMKEPGIWHIYKSNRDDPNCQARLDEEFAVFKHPKDQDIRDFFVSHCLAARKLDRPESRYWYSNGINTRYLDKNEEVELVEAYASVEDVIDKTNIATKKYYRLLPFKKSALSYAQSYSCDDAGIDLNMVRFPENILLPIVNKGEKNDK
ncbi:MAG: hypothetical protein H7A00_00970 [Hahellaceae bacterium]|nr:hypothetical protein [Hahellaceae bacterium]